MEEEKLTQQQIELIAKYSSGWEVGKTSKDIEIDEKYLANLEGLNLEILFKNRERAVGFPSSYNPYYSIRLNICFKGIAIGQAAYTDNPQIANLSSVYLETLLSRARTEAWRNTDEGIKKAKDLVFRLQDI